MPSDERTQRVLEALADRAAPFRQALSAVRDEIEEYLAAHRPNAFTAPDSPTTLGPFASGRIDARRFDAILSARRVLATADVARLEECLTVITDTLARGDALSVCEVPRGGETRRAIEEELDKAGRAFAAARVFVAVKTGSYRAEQHGTLVRGLQFAEWTRTERELVPPLVVEVEGADLRAETVVDLLDRAARIVFVVHGQASPAPLVRLISPNTFVIQTTDVGALATIGDFSGPAVVAIIPKGCAEFVHDPRRGKRLEDRLGFTVIPMQPPRHGLGARSAWQLAEELGQLAALDEVVKAARDVSVVVVPPELGSNDRGGAVDAVASWMLAQAGFAGVQP